MSETGEKQTQRQIIHDLLKEETNASIIQIKSNIEIFLSDNLFMNYLKDNETDSCEVSLYEFKNEVNENECNLPEIKDSEDNILIFRTNTVIEIISKICKSSKRFADNGRTHILTMTLSENYVVRPSAREYLNFMNEVNSKKDHT